MTSVDQEEAILSWLIKRNTKEACRQHAIHKAKIVFQYLSLSGHSPHDALNVLWKEAPGTQEPTTLECKGSKGRGLSVAIIIKIIKECIPAWLSGTCTCAEST